MIHATRCKYINLIPPVVIKDNASWVTTEVDCKGFDYCVMIVNLGATDIAMAALKVQESDTTGTGFADVTGLIFGTSTNVAGITSVLPSATDDGDIFVFEIDLRRRMRFLDLVATAGNGTAGTYLSGIAELWRAEQMPTTAAERGANQVLRV